MKLIYISGPMSGVENNNYPAFFNAQKKLELDGWKVINPAALDKADPKDYRMQYKDYLQRDLLYLFQFDPDAIYLLKGWENSPGSQVELALFRALKGKEIIYEVNDE